MARQIKSSDIFEGDIFENVRQSAIKTIEQLDKMNAEFKLTAQTMKKELGGIKLDSLTGIKDLIKLLEKANKLAKESEAINMARKQAVSAKTQAEMEALAIEKQRQQVAQETIKTQREQFKATQDQEKAEKAKTKEQEKAAKVARDEASAYKQLERNTRELKNRSKELGAQLLILEQSGKKNTKEWYALQKQYNQTTRAAQQGDAQLKKLDKTVGDNFRNVGNYKSALNGLRSVLGAFGVGFGVYQIKNFIEESINLARVQEKAVGQVNAALTTTGGKVGYTLDELKAKASAFQQETLFGDEQILGDLTSVLLTFTGITGEAFDRAQQAALDLSTRMGNDLKGAAVQLGKALNDPVKGVTALRRVGVSFTAEQMKMIKSLVASGDLMKAQTIILDEMNTEFGGSAKAAAAADGGITQLSNAFGDAREEIGKIILEGIKPFVLSLKDFFANLKPGEIKSFVRTLGTILTVIGKIVLAYGTYRAGILAVNAAQYLFNGGLLTSIKNMGNVFTSTKQVTAGTQQMATGMQSAGRAMTAIPWMAIIALAYELGTAFYDIASGAKQAREAQEKFDKSVAEGQKKAEERTTQRQKDLQKEISALQRLRNENKISEKEFLKRKQEALSVTQKEINQDIKLVNQRKKQYNEELKIATAIEAKIKKQGDVTALNKSEINWLKERNAIFNVEGKNASTVVADLRAAIGATNVKIKQYQSELEQATESTKDATSEVNSNSKANDKNGKSLPTESYKQFKTQVKEVNEYLTEQNELLASIAQLEFEKTVQAKQNEIDALLANDIKYATETGNVQVDALENLIEEKYQLEKQAILDQQKENLKLIEQGYTEQSRKEREELIKNRDELLSQEGISADKKKEIQDNYDKQLEQIGLNDLQRNADFELKKVELKMQTDKEIVALDQQKVDQINDVNDKLFDAQVQYYEKLNDQSRKQLEKELEDEKKAAEIRRELFQLGTDYFIKQSQQRIAQIDKEIQAAEKQYDVLKQLAADGNIDAKESLAAQEKIIAESNRRKEKEQRRQQRLQLLNTAFQTYNSKIEAGSKNPLTETIRDIGLLRAFIETIPAFEKGTEDTGVNGKGVDGKGGFHAILHPNERVIPKSMNQKIGSMSNEQLTKLAQEYQNGRIIKPNEQIGSALDTALLISKLDQLTKTIELKPETNIELGEITQSMMEVVKSTKKGNTTTYNRYKIRK